MQVINWDEYFMGIALLSAKEVKIHQLKLEHVLLTMIIKLFQLVTMECHAASLIKI